MNKSPEIDLLAVALVAAKKRLPRVKKGSVNPFFRSTYADLADIVEVCDPIILEHGLAVVQLPGKTSLHTMLLHESGQWVEEEMDLHLIKEDPQSQGSATTYARRYSYSAVLGIVTEDDDDGNHASQRSESRSGGGASSLSAPPRDGSPSWRDDPPTQAQLGALARKSFHGPAPETKGEAADLLDSLQ